MINEQTEILASSAVCGEPVSTEAEDGPVRAIWG